MDETPIKTGFTDLDEIIGGLYPGELMVIGSRPAICKTSFLAPLLATFANSVLTLPGQSAHTWIPRGFNSAARASVKLRT